MGVETAIAAVGFGVSLFGSKKSDEGHEEFAAAQTQEIEYEKQLEDQRKIQMNLDAGRRRREIIRTAVANRSYALAAATNQGAADSSGLQGAYGNIAGRENVDILGVSQNREIGNTMFGINRNLLDTKIAMAGAQSDIAEGQSTQALGGQILGSAGAISRVGQTAFSGFTKLFS